MNQKKIVESIVRTKRISGSKGLVKLLDLDQNMSSLDVLLTWRFLFGGYAMGEIVIKGIAETDTKFHSDMSKLKPWGKFDESDVSGYCFVSKRKTMYYERLVNGTLPIPEGESGDFVRLLEKLGFHN